MPAFSIQRKVDGAAMTFPLTHKELEAAAAAWQAIGDAIFEIKFEVASVYRRYTYAYSCFEAIGIKVDESVTEDLAAKIVLETNCEGIPNKTVQNAAYTACIERYVENHIRETLIDTMLPWFSGVVPKEAVEPIIKAETDNSPEIKTSLISLSEALRDKAYDPSVFCIQNPDKFAQRLLNKEVPVSLLARICGIFLDNGKKVADPDSVRPFYILETCDQPKKQLFRHVHLAQAADMAMYYPRIRSISMVIPDGDTVLIWEKSETQKEENNPDQKPVAPDPLQPKQPASQTAEYMAETYDNINGSQTKEFHYAELSEAVDFATSGDIGLVWRISDSKIVYNHPGGYADGFITG